MRVVVRQNGKRGRQIQFLDEVRLSSGNRRTDNQGLDRHAQQFAGIGIVIGPLEQLLQIVHRSSPDDHGPTALRTALHWSRTPFTPCAKASSNTADPMVKALAPAAATSLIRFGESMLPATMR